MKTEGVVPVPVPVPAAPFSGRKQSLIEDARRRERSSGSAGSPGPSRYGDGFVFEEKDGRVTLNVLFGLSTEKHAGFFKTGKIFEVRAKQHRKYSDPLQHNSCGPPGNRPVPHF